MRSGARSLGLRAALVLAVASSASASPSLQTSPAPSAKSLRADYQQYLINVADHAARWKSRAQGIKPRTVCADDTAASIDESVAVITKDVDTVQSKIQALAQRETLGGDIELLSTLQSVSSDAARLESLLPCPQKSKQNPLAAGVIGAWLEQVREIRKQAAEDISKLQAESTTEARKTRADEERVRWQFKDLVELVKAIAWPLVLVVALIAFRRPISRFVEQIAGKITKVSAFDVAIELATVPSAPTPWLDPHVYAGSELFGGSVTSTTIATLFERIRADMVWSYLIVDLGEGHSWLESRLYLFATILQHMGGLRCVVFVQSAQGHYRRFLGIARPESVQHALGEKYPWFRQVFEGAIAAALAESSVLPAPPALPGSVADFVSGVANGIRASLPKLEPMLKDVAQAVSEKFIFDPNMQTTTDPKNPDWSQLGRTFSWDHSRWLTLERFNRDLRSVVFDVELSQLEDTPDTRAEERTRALLRRRVPFVSIVNRRGEFQRLIDRQVLVEQVAAKLGEPTA
jgi:hypothetical protein